MEIRNLITFVQVAELGSFTKAAQVLDYSQSTVSFQIKQLEAELQCLLFDRINNTLTLTERGHELLTYAQRIRYLTDEFQQSMHGEGELRGKAHIVTPDSVCEALLTRHYAEFSRLYPGITLRFSTADTATMFRMLDHNEADAIITLDQRTFQKNFVIAREVATPMHFVASARSPLRMRRSLSLSELAGERWILTEKGMGYRGVLDDALAQHSIELSPVLEISRTDIIMDLIEQGDALSFLPDFVTSQRVQEGRLCYLSVEDGTFDIWQQLVYHKSKWISRSLRALLDFLIANEFDR